MARQWALLPRVYDRTSHGLPNSTRGGYSTVLGGAPRAPTESEIMRMRLPTAALRCSSRASRAMIDPGKYHIVDGRAAAPIGPACPHRMPTARLGRKIVNAHRRSETWNAAQRSANTHTRAGGSQRRRDNACDSAATARPHDIATAALGRPWRKPACVLCCDQRGGSQRLGCSGTKYSHVPRVVSSYT